MTELKDTLKERGGRYGAYVDNARIEQALKRVMHAEPGWAKLSDVQKSVLEMTAVKQARILSGDPNYPDNWHDVQGYNKLAEDDVT